jgi:hypothetical protein
MQRALFLVAAALTAMTQAASADRPELAVVPTHVRFGKQPFESNTMGSFTITNRSSQTLVVTIDQIQVGDDFSPGQIESTCTLGDTLLPAGESCTHVIGFRPSLFFAGRETAFMNVTARDAWGILLFERTVKLSGTGFAD